MRAVMIEAPGVPARVVNVPDPTPGAGEIVVAVRGCGICGTDRHILEEGLPTARYPLVPGHEPWGEVVAVSAGARALVGDLVAVDPSLHCGACPQCRRGRGNLCERWGAIGGTERGAWADYVLVPDRNAYVLPAGYPLDCASLIEPVACAVRGMKRLRPEAGQSAIVFGGGTMGLLLGTLLELAGCEPVRIVELDPARRANGASRTGLTVIAPDALGDDEAELVVDATGVSSAVEAALDHVAPGGTVMIFGVSSPDARVSLSPFDVYQRELTIVGSMAILHSYQPAVELVGRHPERFRPLLTHAFDLDEFDRAVSLIPSGDAIKIVIAPERR
jgi:2-desacetyl-2-hydroxyethyl bacteriochlorophyllide A dehydrogenase